MGGARCSYRSCTQKSDGVTHMFHFPVFDKVRCHQWLTNAQKLNFLDLKLSQLQNRHICQHHFTDDCFMNSLKKKLVKSAVPTKNGPLCNESDSLDGEKNKEMELPINIEDIENEHVPKTEKKDHLSDKYGDFLTNDISDYISPKNKSATIVVGEKGMIFNRSLFKFNGKQNQKQTLQILSKKNYDIKKKKTRIIKCIKMEPEPEVVPTQEVAPINYGELKLNLINEKPNDSEYKRNLLHVTNQTTEKSNSKEIFPNHCNRPKSTSIPPAKRVKIISEKHISEPFIISKGEFQPVSPSIVINLPRKEERSNVAVNGQQISTIFLDNMNLSQSTQQVDIREGLSQIEDPVPINNYGPSTLFHEMSSTNNTQISKETIMEDVKPKEETKIFRSSEHIMLPVSGQWTNTTFTEQPLITLSDLQLPPACTSAVDTSFIQSMEESKAGLQNIDTPSTKNIAPETKQSQVPTAQTIDTVCKVPKTISDENVKQLPFKSSPTKSLKNKIPPEKLAEIEEKRKYNMKLRDIIDSCLNKIDEEPESVKLNAIKKKEMISKKVGEYLDVPSQNNNIAYLETRLQRLEDTLLNKIEQNTQKITDIKKLLKPNTSRKSTATQTYQTPDVTKKSLYQQISQYLSAEANSLIYEELFINSCVSKPKESPTKRRRRI